MKRSANLLIFCLLVTGKAGYSQQTSIRGCLDADSTWLNKVYISYIPDFGQLFMASDKLIVAEADIDSNGCFNASFRVNGNQALYRLHCIKKNDPVSTIIIGSREENHVFFIADSSGTLELKRAGAGELLNQQNIRGGTANAELNYLLSALKDDQITRDSLKNLLLTMADTCTTPVVGLLALHSTFGLSEKQKSAIGAILTRYDKNNQYGNRLFEEFKPAGYRYRFPVFLICLILFLISAYAGYRVFLKKKYGRIRSLLSQRETTIVRLILEGKTNKEIANTFNIELSTVKTHVNNVYAKLKVSDRKELQKYENIFKIR